MTELVGKVGDEHTLMTVGLGVVGSTYSFGSQFGLSDATPIAQLMSEPEGILVPGDSPFQTLDDFLQAWKADPGGLAVGGGSSPGGPDHLFPMQLAARDRHRPQRRQLRDLRRRRPAHQRAARRRRSTPASPACPSSRGPSTPASCGCWPSRARSATPRAVPFADAPTLTEEGVDLVFLNWRGVLAPPEISDERTRRADRLLRGDARDPGVAAGRGGQRLDRRLQDRRRVRDLHRRAGRTGVRQLSRSWDCCERREAGRPDADDRPGAVRPGRRARRWSASTRSSTPAGSTSGSATRSARASSPTSSAR